MQRFASTLLAVFTIGVLALPYARPLACDFAHSERHGVVHTAWADSADGGLWSVATDGEACHDLMHCGLAPVAPTIEGNGEIAVSPPVAEPVIPVASHLVAHAPPPLTPPPRV